MARLKTETRCGTEYGPLRTFLTYVNIGSMLKMIIMTKYELLYILPTKYTDEEIGGVINNLTEEMKTTGINILNTTQAGKLKLAYPIKHQHYGYYILVSLEAETEALKKFQTYLKMNLEILRSAIYRADSKKALTAVAALKEMSEISSEFRAKREEKRHAPTPAPAPAPEKPKMTIE